MNWLEEEQQRFHRLTASKVKEFSVCVQENIEWISNYVDELLQGHKKTDMSDLLKTPSTNAKRRNNNVSTTTAAQKDVAAQQPQSSSAIDAELKKDRFGSQGGVGVQAQVDLAEYMKQVRQKIKLAQKPSVPSEKANSNINPAVETSRSPKRKSEDKCDSVEASNRPDFTNSKKVRTGDGETAASSLPPVDSSFTRPSQDRSFLLPAEFSKDRISQQIVDSKIKEQEERLKSIFNAGQERLRKAMDSMKTQNAPLMTNTAGSRETMSLANASFATAASDISLISNNNASAVEAASQPSLAATAADSVATGESSDSFERSDMTRNAKAISVTSPAKDGKLVNQSKLPVKPFKPSSTDLAASDAFFTKKITAQGVVDASKSSQHAPGVEDRIQAAHARKLEEEQKRKELLEKREEERRRKFEQIQEAKRKEEEALRKKRLEKQERVLQNQRLLRQKEEERRKQTELQVQAKLKPEAENSTIAKPLAQQQPAAAAVKPAIPPPSLIKKPTASTTAGHSSAVKPAATLFASTTLPKPAPVLDKRLTPQTASPPYVSQSAYTGSANISASSGSSSHGTTPNKRTVETLLPHPSPDVIDPSRTILNKHGDDYVIPAIPSSDDEDSSDNDGSGEDEDGAGNGGKDSFLIPDWAKSPKLRLALQAQKSMEASQIFGEIDALRLEDIFKGSNMKRFRSRTSSADWSRDNW